MGNVLAVTGNGVHRTGKRAFLTVDAVHRKVKKAYLTANGVHRLCFSTQKKLVDCGSGPSLTSARAWPAPALLGDTYAFFSAGGNAANNATNSSDFSANVDVYDEALVKTAANLKVAKRQVASIGTDYYVYVLFGRHYSASSSLSSPYAERFDANLTRSEDASTVTRTLYRASPGAARIGENVIVAGGWNPHNEAYYSDVFSYDSDFTRSTQTSLSVSRYEMGYGSVGNYAIFAGGYGSSGAVSNVDVFDDAFVKSTVTALSASRNAMASMMLDGYVLFARGYGTAYVKTIDVYDKDLTRTLIESSIGNTNSSGFSSDSCCGISGGYSTEGYSSAIDFFNADFTRTNECTLTEARQRHGSVALGQRVIITGGNISGLVVINSVEIFEIQDV